MKLTSATDSLLAIIEMQGDRIHRLEMAMKSGNIQMPSLDEAKRDRAAKRARAMSSSSSPRKAYPVVRLR